MGKKIDEGGYAEFVDKYFPKAFPTLRSKFPATIDWSMGKAPYCTRKPADMEQRIFDDFRFIEHEWLRDEGYLPKDETNPSFVVMVGGITYIPLAFVHIDSVFPLEGEKDRTIINVTSLVDNSPHSYSVVGSIDFVNKRLRIV